MTIKSSVSLKLSNDVDVQELSSAVSLFSQDMYWNLANKSDNVLFSPLGIHAALSMTYLGARNETRDVMEKALE
ncbi:serpin-Z2B, partial [Biomphalaria glabrata]